MLEKAKIDRKLKEVQNTLDSIQATALWMTHHRDDAEAIVARWLAALHTSVDEQRLTLLHLCNEVVQTCSKRRAQEYKRAFRKVLMETATVCSGSSIVPKVLRVFAIWKQRAVFDAEFLDDVTTALNTGVSEASQKTESSSKNEAVVSSQNSTESLASVNSNEKSVKFEPKALLNALKCFAVAEAECNLRLSKLDVNRLPALNAANMKAQVRDREAGCKLLEQYTESKVRLTEVVRALEELHASRAPLIAQLQDAQLFYGAQADANAVGERVRKLVCEMELAKQKVEQLAKDTARKNVNADSNELVEMELSDDETETDTKVTTRTNQATANHGNSKGKNEALRSPEQPGVSLLSGVPLDARAIDQMRKLLHSSSAERDAPSRHHEHHRRPRDRDKHAEERAKELEDNSGALLYAPSNPQLSAPYAPPSVAVPVPVPVPMQVPVPVPMQGPVVQPFNHQAPYAMQGPSFYPSYPARTPFNPYGLMAPYSGPANSYAFQRPQLAVAPSPWDAQRPAAHHASQFLAPRVPPYVTWPSPSKRSRSGEELEEYTPDMPDGHVRRPSSNNITLVGTSDDAGDTYSPMPAGGVSDSSVPVYQPRVANSAVSPTTPGPPNALRDTTLPGGVKLPGFIAQSQPKFDQNASLPIPVAGLAPSARRASAR